MNAFTVEFVTDKETPGTIRYREVEVEGVPTHVGTLYVKKAVAAKMGNPKRVLVQITAVRD